MTGINPLKSLSMIMIHFNVDCHENIERAGMSAIHGKRELTILN